jgi:hypothetical protein
MEVNMSQACRRHPVVALRTLGACLAAFAVACSGGSVDRAAPSLASPPSSSAAPSEAPSSERPDYPNVSSYRDALERYAYKEAYGRCRTLGPTAVADAYGGDPQDVLSMAAAYAQATYPQTVPLRSAATQGCVDGIGARP